MVMNKIPLKYQEDIEKAIILLKDEECKSVFLFGSMVTGKIHDESDIDIGITGLSPQNFFRVYIFVNIDQNNRITFKGRSPDCVFA
jgi:predicted nucleotidyltransferase